MKKQMGSVVFILLGIIFIRVENCRAALDDGLVEYWELDGDYNAGIDPAHAGTLQAKGTGLAESGFVEGKFGQGIDLESSDSSNQASVVIGGAEGDFDFNLESNMSVSLWYTTESLYLAWQTLVGKGENASWRLARNSSTTGPIKLSLSLVAPAKLDQQDGSWHHIVATVDAIEGSRIYVDGELVGTNTAAGSIGDSPNPMQIGGNPQAADRGWDGIIDDVAVWNRAITAEEVASIWNAGSGASIASLIGASDAPFTIRTIDYSPEQEQITLSWDSRSGVFYSVFLSDDLTDWGFNVADSIEADAGDRTTRTFDLGAAGVGDEPRLYFRVEEEK